MVLPESRLRFELDLAPEALIEPVEKLIKVGMERVRQGRTRLRRYANEREQPVTLFHEETNRIYQITDMWVEKKGKEVKSLGFLDGGLIISGFQQDFGLRSSMRLNEIEIPRDADSVDNWSQELFSLRAINPVALELLIKELQESVVILNSKFPNKQ
ncbi:MAG: hypothetical protein A2687_05590 [Candidatus Levybacteria bacterium RIFCSPHIGHO2_01_FULL_38_26]|nr:MAG: hypothetical protein A2687_05590 [Candidatus Levybacteria bacterium RIFCSPHIGHO2_01_FULL_38_26]